MTASRIRIGEAARLIGVHPGSIRNAERAGRIPALPREPYSDDRALAPRDVNALKRYFARSRRQASAPAHASDGSQ